MTPASVRVYFPAVNFRISAVVASADEVSHIEGHVLRAIHLGIDTLEAVAGLLGLRLRLAMEVLNRMLRRNLVVIDFRSGRFAIPRSVREALDELGAPIASGSGKHQIVEYSLCLNRCIGTISGRRHLHMVDPEVPPLVYQPLRSHEIAELDAHRVEAAINQIVRSAGLRVRDVNLISARPEVEGGLVAEASCIEWGDEPENCSVTLQFDARQKVGPQEAFQLESLVLAMRGSHAWWWNRLTPRRVTSKELTAAPSRCIPPSLVSLAAGLDGLDDDVTHDLLVRTLQRLADITRSSLLVEPVVGSAELTSEALRLAEGANEQVVFVCPFLGDDGLRAVSGFVSDPARRATLLVVYGIDASVDADTAARTQALGATRNVVIDPDRGSETHAKLVIQDATSALLTTKNFLSSGPAARLFELGVTLHGGEPVEELLTWTRGVAPSLLANKGAWRRSDFRMLRDDSRFYSLPPVNAAATFGDLVEDVRTRVRRADGTLDIESLVRSVRAAAEQALRSEGSPGRLRIRPRELLNFVTSMGQELEHSHRAPVTLVPTATHRPLVFDALERAEESVLLASHRIGRRSLGLNFVAALRRALERGVHVALLWGERAAEAGSESRDPDATDSLVSQLGSIGAGLRGRLLLNKAPLALHCKLLLLDQAATLITSFDLLNFVDSREYTRHELGLWIESRRIAGKLLDGLRAHVHTIDADFARLLDDHFAR